MKPVPVLRSIHAGLLFALLSAGAAHAQNLADGPVLTGANVTEANIIGALAPDVITGRSVVIGRDSSTAPAKPARPPSASLLVTFETNSAVLTEPARQQLDVVGAALKNEKLAQFNFSVEGHADPRGTPELNQLLSQRRAESVRSYLVTSHAIAPERLRAEGKGDREPLNRSVPAAPENRRVTIVTMVQ